MNTESERNGFFAVPLSQWAIVGVVFFALFMARTVHSEPVDVFDAFTKWHYALKVTETNSFAHIKKDERNAHHKMRWGANLPAVGYIELFGNSMKVYSAVTITAFVVFYILLLRNSLRYLPPALVLLAAVFIYIDPVFMRYTTQLHTRMYGLLYILLAIIALSRQWRGQIFFAALFLFAAYGAKATYGLFLGIPIAAFIFFKRGYKDFIWFSLYTTAFFIIETLLFNSIIDGVSFGRLEVLWTGAHNTEIIPGEDMAPFSIYTNITKPWKAINLFYTYTACFAFLYAAIMLTVPKFRKTLDDFFLLWFATGLSYLLWTWFNFVSFSPYRPLQEPLLFYTVFIFPYMFLIAAHAIGTLLNILPTRFLKPAYAVISTISLGVLVYFVIFGSPMGFSWKNWEKSYYRSGSMWTADEQIEGLAGLLKDGAVGVIEFESKQHDLSLNRYFVLKQLIDRTKTFRKAKVTLARTKKEGVILFYRRGIKLRRAQTCLKLPNKRNLALEYTLVSCGDYFKPKA